MNMEAFRGFLSPLGLNTGSIKDTLKLVVIGGTVETARRVSISAWNRFVDPFYLTVLFSQEDYPYDWLMHWLSGKPGWAHSREFEITTRSVGRNQLNQSTAWDLNEEDMDEGGERVSKDGSWVTPKPRAGTTHTVPYRDHLLKITPTHSSQDFGDYSTLKISVSGNKIDILKLLVLEAKRGYEKDLKAQRVHIFTADAQHARWRWSGKRPKRPMSSIVLEPAIKEALLGDCQDFLCSKDWYSERGIPFRRGYLLHGAPRSGKTSLIYSIASELGLDIFVLILSSKGMCDNTLMTLMSNIPSRCILLLEDLDATFNYGITSTGDQTVPTGAAADGNGGSTVSLSGLLACLDVIDPAEGGLLFFTANDVERLDPALRRPGRMDVCVNFAHVTKWQAESFFKHVFLSRPPASSPNEVPSIDTPRGDSLRPRRKAAAHAMPILEEQEVIRLAQDFADAIPEGVLSFASLEKYLLENKRRPRECVQEVTEWCDAVQLKAVATGSSYFGSIRIRKERKARALD